MKLSVAAAVTATCLSTLSSAVVVDRGLADGIYTIKQDEAHQQKQQSHSKSIAGRKSLKSRGLDLWAKPDFPPWPEYSVPLPINGHGCNDTYGDLNQTDYKVAVFNLNKFCDSFDVSPLGMYISVVGQVMVYVCAYGQLQHCHHYEWEEAEVAIDAACGERGQGYVRMDEWDKRYGRGHVGTEVCEELNKGTGRSYMIDSQPFWVNGDMYEAWKTGTSTKGRKGQAEKEGKEKVKEKEKEKGKDKGEKQKGGEKKEGEKQGGEKGKGEQKGKGDVNEKKEKEKGKAKEKGE